MNRALSRNSLDRPYSALSRLNVIDVDSVRVKLQADWFPTNEAITTLGFMQVGDQRAALLVR